jgi:Fe-S-cluster containining protein
LTSACAIDPDEPMSACVNCGACCASYRVEFAMYELDSCGGTVPTSLTEPVGGIRCRMQGTGEVPIRCVALTGQVGETVGCNIYLQRPLPCRELQEGSYSCEKARARHGLPPLPGATPP